MEFQTITKEEFNKVKTAPQSSWTPEFKAEMKTALDERKNSSEDKQRFRIPLSIFIEERVDSDGNKIPAGYLGKSQNPVKSAHSLILSLLGINYFKDKELRNVVSDDGDGVKVDLTLLN